jgi:FeS assembly SUF system regulator
MIRLTKLTDYGIVLLARMAEEPDRLHSASGLAESTHLPSPMVSKILKLAGRAGLLHSQRGAHGGYRLARAPREISLAEVLAAFEGPIALTDCSASHDDCSVESWCHVRDHWRTINRAVAQALAGVSLAELAEQRTRPARFEAPLVVLGAAHS